VLELFSTDRIVSPREQATHIHLDAVGGVAGDMFIAALLHAFPEHRAGMIDAIRCAGLPTEVSMAVADHNDHVLTGLRFDVDESAAPAAAHVPFTQIRTQLSESPLDNEVKRRAIEIFTLLAEAEAQVHGRSLEDTSFHEVVAWDSIADVVGAAYLITQIGATSWSASKLPSGAGRVNTAHGPLPVPAPATALLLQGFILVDDGIPGERITPTGAAILRHLQCRQAGDAQPRKLLRSGIGFGARRMPRLSNVLRVLAYVAVANDQGDQVAQLYFEVDDQSPEDLALGLDRLRTHPGVIDVLQMPAFGKKNRMTAHVQILADPNQLHEVCDACFRETTTLGIRHQVIARTTLARRNAPVEISGRKYRAKIAERRDGHTAKAENDDLLTVAGGRAEREELRRVIESRALGDKR
jgi:pyridinium-3,5-bisthiocarboxylic acid mononucleotide nickel chelatase